MVKFILRRPEIGPICIFAVDGDGDGVVVVTYTRYTHLSSTITAHSYIWKLSCQPSHMARTIYIYIYISK